MKQKNNFTGPCKKTVIFARVSSPIQEKGASIDAQRETIYQYCKAHNLEIVKEYIITESSTRGDRKQYHQMLNFVTAYKDKIGIVVNCVDRLQRSYKDTPALDELRRQGKIEVHFLKEHLILHKDSTGTDIMFWNMYVLMANSYVLSLSDNVKRSQKHNWDQGKWQGWAPIGYKNIRDENGKANIIVDEERAPLVKKLFEEYALGTHTLQSLENLAKSMNLTTLQKKSKYLSRTHIQNILQNPFYYGMMRIKGELKPHIYEPLISKRLFDTVQDVMQCKSKPAFKLGRGEIPFMFRGIITCAHCGGTITCESHTSKSGKTHIYLKCNHKKGPCTQGIVKEEEILEQLNDQVFSKICITDKMCQQIKQEIRSKLREEQKTNNVAKKNILTRLTELKNMENRLLDFYLQGKCNDTIYDKKQQSIEAERKELYESMEKYEENIDKDVDILSGLADITSAVKNFMKCSIISEKRALLNLILSNSRLDGTTLCFDLKKPFDKLLFAKGCKLWLRQLDSNQRHTD